jgi:hypothetical protein
LSSVRTLLLAAISALVVLSPASTEATVARPAPVAAPELNADSAFSIAALTDAAREAGLRSNVLDAALRGYRHAVEEGVAKPSLLTVIDYSLPSRTPRLWVLDLDAGKVLMHELVAHGRGTGLDSARLFSNKPGSYKSSLGTFITGATYRGANGLSLRLRGIDEGLNDRAAERAIVIHGAWYVSDDIVRMQGRLGRSEGCPALSQDVAPRVIDLIRDGSVVFSYFPSPELEQRLAN